MPGPRRHRPSRSKRSPSQRPVAINPPATVRNGAEKSRGSCLSSPDRRRKIRTNLPCCTCVESGLATAARRRLRRIPVSNHRSRLRTGVARIPRRHGDHQCVVVVDALAVPVRGGGLAVDCRGRGSRSGRRWSRGMRSPAAAGGRMANSVGVDEPERAVIEALARRTRPRAPADDGSGRAGQGCRARSLRPRPSAGRGGRAGAGWRGSRGSGIRGRGFAERAADHGGDAAGAATDAERLAVGTVHHGDDSGVAAQPPGGLRRDGRCGPRFRTAPPGRRRALRLRHGPRFRAGPARAPAHRRIRTAARPSTPAHRRGAPCATVLE